MICVAMLASAMTCMAQDAAELNRFRMMAASPTDTTKVNGLRGLGRAYLGIRADSAIYFNIQALRLAEHINWTKGIAQCSLNLGASYAYIGAYDSAILYSTRALAPARIIGDKSRLALIYINRGESYAETQQYELALQDNRQAVRFAEESGNKDRQARAAQNMCAMYMNQDNYTEALPWAQKSYELNKEIGNDEMLSVAEMSLGGLLVIKKDYKKANAYLLSATERAKKNERPDVVVESAMSLAESYTRNGRFTEAVQVINNALPFTVEGQLKDRHAALLDALASAYLGLGQYNDALRAGRSGYQLVMGNDSFQKRQYLNLYEIAAAYNGLHEYKKAFDTSLLATALKDTLMKTEQGERLLKLQTQFETEEKEKQIVLLQKQQQLNVANEQRQRTFRIAAYIIVALLVLIAVLVINRFRILNRTRRRREMEEVRNNIARDLHDDIGSTLTSINVLSTVALKQSAGADFNGNVSKIRERSAGIMERMNDIVWAINPMNDALDKLLERMQAFLQEMCEQAGMDAQFSVSGNVAASALSLAQRNQLYLVFKECVNNAVKYSKGSRISVSLERKGAMLTMTVKDNGKGFDPASPNSALSGGNGLMNMKSRAKEMNGQVLISSGPGDGTEVKLEIPVE